MTDIAGLVLRVDALEVAAATQKLEGLSRQGRETELAIDKFSNSISSGFQTMRRDILSFAASYASIQSIKSLADAALDVQKFSNSLQVGLGNVHAVNSAMGFLRSTSGELGLDLRASTEQFSKLAAAAKGTALEGQATRDIFLGISKAATALGLSSQETSGALLAIQQMVSKGKVSLEELSGQLGERLPGALQIASRAMGMTTQELGDFVSKGKLTADELLPKLSAELEKTFGTQSQTAAGGLQAQINRFNTALFDMKVALGETGLIEFLTSGIQLATRFANAMAGVFGAKQLSDIDKQQQKIAELGERIATIKDRLNFPGYKELFFDKAEFDELNQRLEDASLDLVTMRKAADDAASAIAHIPGTKPAVPGKSEDKKISESDKFIASLRKQAEQAGKTSTEIMRLEAAHLGVSKQAEAHISAIEQYNIAQADGSRLNQQHERDMLRIEQITESTRTAQEQYNASVAELERLLEQGLDFDTFDRELTRIERKLIDTGDAGKKSFDEMSQFAIQAQRNLQDALGDALFNGISGKFDDMVDGFTRAIKQMVAQAMAADIWGAIFNKKTGGGMAGLLGSFGMSGNASAGGMGMMDMASLGSSALNFASSGFGSMSALSGMGSSLPGSMGAFFSGMGGGTVTGVSSQAALMGSSFAAVAGPLAAAAALTAIFRGFAGDKRMGGGFGKGLNAVGDIPILGDFIPVVPIMNTLFGRGPLKQKETNLIGDITADGFGGITSTKFKAQGGWARSDKVDRVMTDTDTGKLLNQFGELVEGGISKVLDPFAEQAREYSLKLGQYLDDSISGMSKSLRGMADTLGIGSGALDDFSMSINIASEKGKALTDEQIAKVIADAADAMASKLVPGIETLSKAGETAFTTLQRISSEFGLLTNLGSALGNSLSTTRAFLNNVSIQDRTAFVDDAGGLDALSGKIQFFFDNFLTGAEQLQPSIELLDEQMGKLGLSADMSKEQFKSLVQSFGHIDGVSADMLQSLLNIAPLFVRVKDAMNTTADATFNLAEAEGLIADKRSALIAAYGREKSALESVVSRFRDLSVNLRSASDSLSLSSLSPLTPQQRLDEARTQFNRDRLLANTGDQDALRRLPESGKAFLEASQIFNASSAEFVSDFNLVKSVLDSAAALADTEAEIAQKQLTQLESQVSKLVDIDNSVIDVKTGIDELTKAVLQGFGNPNITDQQIRDFVNTPGRTTQEIIDAAVYNNVSAGQFSNATGTSLSDISAATGGASLSDDQINDFFWQNISNPRLIYDTAKQFGISLSRVASAAGFPFTDLEQWVKSNNLPMFERGTDYVQKGGLAMLHPAEAVTPASHMQQMATEIKALRQELSELRREQNQQTGALINVAMESSRQNANMINQHNQDIAKSSAWREQSKAGIR